jgi:hypothetical protein
VKSVTDSERKSEITTIYEGGYINTCSWFVCVTEHTQTKKISCRKCVGHIPRPLNLLGISCCFLVPQSKCMS